MNATSIKTVLLGTGYTLERVAAKLPHETTLLVTKSAARARSLLQWHPQVVQLDVSKETDVASFFEQYPNIRTVVDGIPPLREGQVDRGASYILRYLPETVKRLIYLSTSGVFGVSDGSVVNEKTSANPQHDRGKARLAVEQVYQGAACEFLALRVPAIYGPGRGIGMSLQSERLPYVNEGKRWSNRIHVEDLAEIVHRSIITDSVLPPVLAVGDDCPALMSEIVEFYCEKFSLSFPRSISKEEVAARGMTSLLSNQRVDNTMMKSVLDIELEFPSYREGAGTEFEVR